MYTVTDRIVLKWSLQWYKNFYSKILSHKKYTLYIYSEKIRITISLDQLIDVFHFS